MLKYFLFFSLLSLGACNSSVNDAPQNLIPMDKMQYLLRDIHYADGLAKREGENDNSIESRTKILYKEVFAKYNISEEQFFESYNYYLNHVEKLDSIYGNIITEISKEQAEIQAKNIIESTDIAISDKQ